MQPAILILRVGHYYKLYLSVIFWNISWFKDSKIKRLPNTPTTNIIVPSSFWTLQIWFLIILPSCTLLTKTDALWNSTGSVPLFIKYFAETRLCLSLFPSSSLLLPLLHFLLTISLLLLFHFISDNVKLELIYAYIILIVLFLSIRSMQIVVQATG